MNSRQKSSRSVSVATRGVRITAPTPDMAQMLRDLDLAWMLDARRLPAANEPMRGTGTR
jgi:hypothetical protein